MGEAALVGYWYKGWLWDRSQRSVHLWLCSVVCAGRFYKLWVCRNEERPTQVGQFCTREIPANIDERAGMSVFAL